MSSAYAYTPEIWPSILTVLLLIALAVYAWRRRSVPGARVFAVACLIAVPWVVGAALEMAAVYPADKIFWFKFQAAWQLPAITALTCFVLEYAWPGRWLTRRNLVLLSILSLLLLDLILIVTDNVHHLAWQGFTFDDGQIVPIRGPVNWLVVLCSYVMAIPALIAFAWLFIRSPQHRWPVALMFAGAIVGRVLYALEAARVLPFALPFNVPPIVVEYLMCAVALFGFHIFDPIPLAHRTAIEQMHTGLLVLDPQGRVTDLNPAAERILAAPASSVRGQLVRALLPVYRDGQLANAEEAEIELSLPERHSRQSTGTVRDGTGAGQVIRHYTLEISLLKDWRGLTIGRLLLLHDVSEQKRAQAQLLEQQRALAMLHEREQLARELHDSTGQALGYAGFQLEVVHDRIMDGQAALSAGQVADVHTHLAEAGNQLTRLSSIVAEAHADVREYILNLQLAPSNQRPFFATLQHYLDGFSLNYSIQTELLVGSGIDEGKFDPEAQMQLFRVIQEALSNARKHAGASCLQVSFEKQDHLVRIRIQDNGRGFDPAPAMSDSSSHFGLRFMRERAEQIGGNLRVQSAPGEGTRVILDVPVEGKN